MSIIARITPIPIKLYPINLLSPKKNPARINPKARPANRVNFLVFLSLFLKKTSKAIMARIRMDKAI